MVLTNKSNDEIHRELINRKKEQQKQSQLVLLNKRKYILPMQLLKLMLTYLPGYYIVWLPSGEMTIKHEMPLSIPSTSIKYAEFIPRCYFYKEYNEEYDESEYDHYEKKYNPDYD